jgi:hypothetical protein
VLFAICNDTVINLSYFKINLFGKLLVFCLLLSSGDPDS